MNINYKELAPYIQSVCMKLQAGVYQTEDVPCVCGSTDDVEITKRDRYLIPHRMVLCKNCGLIRANPRMTKESYDTFYNAEYRPLYNTTEFGPQSSTTSHDAKEWLMQGNEGISFREFLTYFHVKPKVVVEIGCGQGGFLHAFDDCEVYGVEIDRRTRERGSVLGGLSIFESLDVLVEKGIKADLVILNDVIEHLTDFSLLQEIPKILAKNGYLYVDTPGIFHRRSSQVHMLWQNAHTFQFCGITLQYVMQRNGWEPIFLDERIHSIWQFNGLDIDIQAQSRTWIAFQCEHLLNLDQRTIPPIRGVCKFNADIRVENTRQNLRHGFRDMNGLIDRDKSNNKPACVIAAGASADEFVDEIRQRKAEGAAVFVVERMYPWALQHGILPDWVVILDASDDVAEGLNHLAPGVRYLVSSVAQPKAVDKVAHLKDDVFFFTPTSEANLNVQDIWHEYGYEHLTMVSTGSSVALCAGVLALMLGHRALHFYGFDLKVKEQAGERDGYAKGVAGQGVPRKYIPIRTKDKQIWTCMSFVSFAQQFFRIMSDAHQKGALEELWVHGDSLVNDLWDGKFIKE